MRESRAESVMGRGMERKYESLEMMLREVSERQVTSGCISGAPERRNVEYDRPRSKGVKQGPAQTSES